MIYNMLKNHLQKQFKRKYTEDLIIHFILQTYVMEKKKAKEIIIICCQEFLRKPCQEAKSFGFNKQCQIKSHKEKNKPEYNNIIIP